MEFELPGEEKKKRWEAKAEVKSGMQSPSESVEENNSSSVAAAAAVVVEEEVPDFEVEKSEQLASYKELKFLKTVGSVVLGNF